LQLELLEAFFESPPIHSASKLLNLKAHVNQDFKLTIANEVLYEVFVLDPRAHTFRVKLTLTNPLKDQIINFPSWIAGSYMVRDFAKHLHNLGARQGSKIVPTSQLTKSSWKIQCVASAKLTLVYDVYAHDSSVRGAWLDETRAFFNGTSLFFECEGHSKDKHFVQIHQMPLLKLKDQPNITESWRVYTSLEEIRVSKAGWGLYAANSFEDLVDTPVLMSDAWQAEFAVRTGAHTVKHRLVLTGVSPSFDGNRLVADTEQICKTVIDFWHKKSKPVIGKYLFIVNVVQDGYGGLEHKTSTVLQCKRADLPSVHKPIASEGYIGLLGLISHEYFHTWNVKRLRPKEFESYKFNSENYTDMLWFFEGFTSYYDDLLLRRCGLINDQQYLKLLTKSIQQVLQTPGRHIQSVAAASFDAWIKYYKPDENTPNTTVSYYTKGAMIAMCFDLKLRAHNSSLDAVMRELFKRSAGGPITEDDFKTVLHDLSNKAWDTEILEWVHGLEDPPYATLLQSQGIKVEAAPDSLQQQLGLRLDDSKPGVHIKIVLADGLAAKAGFAPGDEWLGVIVPDVNSSPRRSSTQQTTTWRIQKIDDLMMLLGEAKYFEAMVCRDQRILTLRVDFQIKSALADKSNFSLCIADSSKAKLWLTGK
jgi:predicted metalloprotease with PDZ domain